MWEHETYYPLILWISFKYTQNIPGKPSMKILRLWKLLELQTYASNFLFQIKHWGTSKKSWVSCCSLWREIADVSDERGRSSQGQMNRKRRDQSAFLLWLGSVPGKKYWGWGKEWRIGRRNSAIGLCLDCTVLLWIKCVKRKFLIILQNVRVKYPFENKNRCLHYTALFPMLEKQNAIWSPGWEIMAKLLLICLWSFPEITN